MLHMQTTMISIQPLPLSLTIYLLKKASMFLHSLIDTKIPQQAIILRFFPLAISASKL